MSKNRSETRKIELVETDNIARSLDRMCVPYRGDRWKRALYHALAMSKAGDRSVVEKIRLALELP